MFLDGLLLSILCLLPSVSYPLRTFNALDQ